MSLTWVIVGSVVQLMLSLFVFMVVAFSAGGVANGNNLNRIQVGILNLSIYVLPALCLLSAGIVIFCYKTGGSAYSYWWYTAPVILTLAYLFYANSLNN